MTHFFLHSLVVTMVRKGLLLAYVVSYFLLSGGYVGAAFVQNAVLAHHYRISASLVAPQVASRVVTTSLMDFNIIPDCDCSPAYPAPPGPYNHHGHHQHYHHSYQEDNQLPEKNPLPMPVAPGSTPVWV